MGTKDSIFIFRDLEADSYFQAIVVLDYYFDYAFWRPFGYSAARLRDHVKSKEISEIYKVAITRKFIPEHMPENEKDAFLKKPREYTLQVMREGKPGILGLGKSPCWFNVVLTEYCLHCKGKLQKQYATPLLDSHSEVFVCSQCKKFPTVQPPYSSSPHEFGLPISEGCLVVKKCKECGYSSVVSEHHHYGEWKSDPDHICRQIRICSACHAVDGREFHTWEVISRTVVAYGWNEHQDMARNRYKYEVVCTLCKQYREYESEENE